MSTEEANPKGSKTPPETPAVVDEATVEVAAEYTGDVEIDNLPPEDFEEDELFEEEEILEGDEL